VLRLAALVLVLGTGCGKAGEARPPPIPHASHPVRIVPGNTAAAEFLATILGDEGAPRFAAIPEQVDAYSSLDFHRAPWSEVARFARYEPEPMLALRPDLVVTHEWQSPETTQFLRAQGIHVVVLASASGYEPVRASLEALGKVVDAPEQAAAAIARLDERIERLRAGIGRREGLRVLEYTNDGTGGWTAGLDTTADAMIRLAGMRNAAGEAAIHGHVRLGSERLLQLDPDILVVGAPARDDIGSATKGVLESVPAYATLSAVKSGRIVVLSAPLMSSDSPCLVLAAEALAAEVDRLLAVPGPASGQ
jgi:ABC-type Fe3+-hydroxamate transport system substrate-binding protein